MPLTGKILAFDTALGGVSVGLYDAGQGLCLSDHRDTVRGQAEHLIPMTQSIVAQAGLSFDALDAIVTTIGPGSFTGLRLALSAAKSYGLALSKPVLGISSLQALALGYAQSLNEQDDCHIVALIETKRADYYLQSFDLRVQAQTQPEALTLDQLVQRITAAGAVQIIGDALPRFKTDLAAQGITLDPAHVALVEGYDKIDAGLIARIAVEKPELFVSDPSPLYLRGADVSLPKHSNPRVSD